METDLSAAVCPKCGRGAPEFRGYVCQSCNWQPDPVDVAVNHLIVEHLPGLCSGQALISRGWRVAQLGRAIRKLLTDGPLKCHECESAREATEAIAELVPEPLTTEMQTVLDRYHRYRTHGKEAVYRGTIHTLTRDRGILALEFYLSRFRKE